MCYILGLFKSLNIKVIIKNRALRGGNLREIPSVMSCKLENMRSQNSVGFSSNILKQNVQIRTHEVSVKTSTNTRGLGENKGRMVFEKDGQNVCKVKTSGYYIVRTSQ